jgi:hypothetical protein
MDAVARWIVRHPWFVVISNLVITGALGVFAVRIEVESSLESVLPAGDPAVAYYEQVRATFGSDDVAVVGVGAQDLFATLTLEKIARLTEALGKIDGVERVLSITNAVDPAADVFDPPPLLARIPPPPGAIEALKQKLRSRPLYGKNLVADDFHGAAINVFFKNLTDAQYRDLHIDEKIRDILGKERGSLYYTGVAHVKQAAVEMMRHDLMRFTPIALGLVLLTLWLSFWTIRGIALPTLSVILALIWTIGVMVLMGKSITLGTFILPPLLIVLGSSYGIHVMARYYEQVNAGAPADELVVRAFARVWLPLVVSALTMSIGFGSLMLNRITAIRDLGFFAVIGLVWLTVTSLTLIPAALQILSVEPRTRRSGKIAPWLARVLQRLAERASASRQPILLLAFIASFVCITGIGRIEVDSDFLSYFDADTDVRRDNEAINQHIVGSNPFYLVIEGQEPGVLKRWEVLKQIKELQDFLATLPGITASVSLVDYLELLESGLHKSGEGDVVLDEHGKVVEGGAPKTFWEEPSSLTPVLNMVSASPATFRSVVTQDFRQGTVLVRTNLSGSRRIEETLAAIRTYIAEHLPADLKVTPTGNLVLLTGTTSDIVSGQIRSLSVALGIIFVVMALMFLSVKVGFLAIVPNLLPIVVFFAVMGWLGIYLNLGTSLIAAIALGIAVDSTIHYMARLNLELSGETSQQAAMVRALQAVGPPIIFTSAALVLGFLTFAFSSFVPIQNFGVLTCITMATALGTNLVLLPAILATTKIITLWDMMAVKLGRDPAQTIPLFAGLRPSHARIVALMGQLRHFAAGDVIVRQGEVGDEMFVIIKGTTEVFAGEGSARKAIAELRRGEVFGEMALVRNIERSADVIAADDVEVLVVDQRFLDRIQRRYPRIAAKVFLNLTRIVSDRLQRMTQQFVASR